jgi:hypothetical protein
MRADPDEAIHLEPHSDTKKGKRAVAVFIPAAAQVYNQPYLAQYSGSACRW